MSEALKSQIVQHDWDSYETRDLMDRLHILDRLAELPQRELAEILKLPTPETVAKIMRLMEIRYYRKNNP